MNDITADAAKALQSSMLQRVPDIAADLVRGGMEPVAALTTAIIKARDIEDQLSVEWIRASEMWRNGDAIVLDSREQIMIDYIDAMTRRIWTKARVI